MTRVVACAVAALLALPAVVLTAARLAGGANPRVAIVQAFTPWAIPLYILLLALLCPLLLRPVVRRPRRRPAAVAGLVVAALLGVHLAWLSPVVLGDAPPADPEADSLTVMTSNLRFGEADVEAVVAAARSRGVDLLVLQEVTPDALAALQAAGVEDRYPHRAGRAMPGATGTVALSRTPVDEQVRVGTAMGTWAFTTAGLRVIAVHPAYPLSDTWGEELSVLRQAIEDLGPDVVVGDFNATRDHEPMRAILATGLSDAAEIVNAGWQPTWPTNGFHGLPLPASMALDHVLVGPALTATRTTTLEVVGTDHRALVATVVPAAR